MSKIIDVPNKLGERLMTGWVQTIPLPKSSDERDVIQVLTDCPCPSVSCKGVPLLRSPDGQEPVIHYCANCGGTRNAQWSEGTESSSSTFSSASYGSRPSTPPTDLSSSLSSPTFAPPVETEDVIRRRQQSDQASNEIGKRLLKGWAMLGDECPNTRCYGVPLVRPPKTGIDKDPRKECVICGTIYITEDSEGWQRLVPVSAGASAPERRITAAGSDQDNGYGPQPIQLPTLDPPLQTPKSNMDFSGQAGSELQGTQLVPAVPTTTVPLDASIQALELALSALTERLSIACANPSLLDPTTVGVNAEAIGKVAHALGQVKQLRHQGDTLNGVIASIH